MRSGKVLTRPMPERGQGRTYEALQALRGDEIYLVGTQEEYLGLLLLLAQLHPEWVVRRHSDEHMRMVDLSLAKPLEQLRGLCKWLVPDHALAERMSQEQLAWIEMHNSTRKGLAG